MKREMIEDLRLLVECESPTEDLSACRRVVQLAVDMAKRVTGNEAELIQENGRPIFWLGSKKPKVVLLAHLDTVWPIGSFTPIWQIDGDLIKGPGCYDMKGGFIQALYALQGIDLRDVALIATTDEETGSATSRKLIEEISKVASAVLVLESAIDGKVKVGRKGTSMYTISIQGRAAHAGLEPEKGINATIEMAAIVDQLTKLADIERGTSVVPTVLKSGTTTNTVPALAVLDVDSRSFTMKEMERVKDAIYALTPIHPQARIEVIGGINRPPLEESSTSDLYKLCEEVARKLGMAPLGSAIVGGASDGNFAGQFTKVLDGLGAVGSGAHALTENISASDLEPRALLLRDLIKAIAR